MIFAHSSTIFRKIIPFSEKYISNIPENYIQRLETLQFMMNELGKLIFPVHRLIDDLSQSLVHGVNKDSLILEFMQCHYWENLTMSETARKIGITYRRCEKLRAELISDMKKYIKDTAQKP